METIRVVSGDGTEAGAGGADLDMGTQGISIVQIALPHQTMGSVTEGDSEDDDDDDEMGVNAHRELQRRPSYRKILNDVMTSNQVTIVKGEENDEDSDDMEGNEAATALSSGAMQFQTTAVMPSQIQIGGGDGTGLQTLTMTNSSSAATNQQAATIVQYAQGPDGQFFIPVSNLSSGGVQAYQIASPSTSLAGGVVMATAGGSISGGHQLTEEVSRKRELRLLKNRDAARECRRKKKEYVKCLENRVAVLENQNKALIEELKSLKELYCQKDG